MKQIFLILFTVVLMVSFAACSDTKKPTGQAEPTPVVESEEAPQEEVAAPVTKKPEEMLKDFEAYVKEYAEAYNNKTKDIRKYQTLASRSQQEVANLESIKTEFSAQQLKRYEKAKENVIKINSGK